MPAPWHFESPQLLVRKLAVGGFENNVYVVACAVTGEALVVDPGFEPDRVEAAVADVDPVAVVITHGHADHVGAARETAGRMQVPLLMHPADVGIAGFEPDKPLTQGTLTAGRLEVEVRHTPGHTPGSTCLLVPGVVFTGDTLFPGGPGTTRFPYSSFETIVFSLAASLFTLDPATLVMPGHGLDTTIGAEAPMLDAWKERGW
jgi:glyoxylase-like metal-dependent hydrolase (beta-lactamase superfamily II)